MGDERLALARSALGVAPPRAGRPAASRQAVELPLLQGLARVQKEQTDFARELARIRALPDTTEQMLERATLYRERGICCLSRAVTIRDAVLLGLARQRIG